MQVYRLAKATHDVTTHEKKDFTLVAIQRGEIDHPEKDHSEKDHSDKTTKMAAPGRETGTGLVYDDIMTKHKDPNNDSHVENPARITVPYDTLRGDGCFDQLVRIPARAATDDELCLVHTKEHVQNVKGYGSSCTLPSGIPETFPTYICNHTYEAAVTAVGCCLNLVNAILTSQVKNGFALVRPCGHHAEKGQSNGFCYFNNIAIAARYIQQKHSDLVKKILILDWDIHHGNGTQHEFYKDDDVMYISIHRYDDGRYYPHLPEGDVTAVGEGKGKGFNINIPWNGDKMGNSEYIASFHQIVIPVIKSFQPDILLVSAGFDAAERDPLGEYHVTPVVYGYMLGQLMDVTNGRVGVVLEGGYNVETMAQSILSCVKSLLREKPWKEAKLEETDNICQSAKETLNKVIGEHAKYWPIKDI